MQRIIAKTSYLIMTLWLSFFLACLGLGTPCGATTDQTAVVNKNLILLLPQNPLGKLQRPPVTFNHDLHTSVLRESGQTDCTVCHVTEDSTIGPMPRKVVVFRFPKAPVDPANRAAVMQANHNECVSCHRKMASSGKRSGPDIGLCGKCHVKSPFRETKWQRKPIFNYVTHAKHLKNIELHQVGSEFAVVADLKIDPAALADSRRCELCHHVVDEGSKKLIYKKDCENSCGSCHKAQDEKNVRSLKNVVHAACITCHMKTHEAVKKAGNIRSERKWGPYDCKGCHGEQKVPTREEIQQLPRLVRGQKDIMDLSYSIPKDQTLAEQLPLARMKAVPFNHKMHEPRVEFCNTCHHHSLEKCANCHPRGGGDIKKGGGVSYERAYHSATARQACAGCHNTEKEKATCAGCHIRQGTELPRTSCQICHRGPLNGNWPEAPLISDHTDPQKVPERIKIKTLQKEFEPADFQHVKIIKRLIGISNQNPLAKWFHAGNQRVMCDSCHHHSPPEGENSVPKCVSCHGRSFDPAMLGRPGTLAAYHRQCMECHENMKQKPLSLECTKCHAEKGRAATTALIIDQFNRPNKP